MIKNLFKKELSEIIKKLIFSKFSKAGTLIKNLSDGDIDKQYIIESVFEDIKALNISPKIKFFIIIFGFILKGLISEEVQSIFDGC